MYDPLTYRHAKTTASYFHTYYFHMFYIGLVVFNDPQRLHLFVMNNHHQYPVSSSSSHLLDDWGCPKARLQVGPSLIPALRSFAAEFEAQEPLGAAGDDWDCPLGYNEQPSSRYKTW